MPRFALIALRAQLVANHLYRGGLYNLLSGVRSRVKIRKVLPPRNYGCAEADCFFQLAFCSCKNDIALHFADLSKGCCPQFKLRTCL